MFALLGEYAEDVRIKELVDKVVAREGHRLEVTIGVILVENSVDAFILFELNNPSDFALQVLHRVQIQLAPNTRACC